MAPLTVPSLTYSVPVPAAPPVGVAAPLPLPFSLACSLSALEDPEREKFLLCSFPPPPPPLLPPPRLRAASRWEREVWFFSSSLPDFFDLPADEEAEAASVGSGGCREPWFDRLEEEADEAPAAPCV